MPVSQTQVGYTNNEVQVRKGAVLMALLDKIEEQVKEAGHDQHANEKLRTLVNSFAILASETPQNPAGLHK